MRPGDRSLDTTPLDNTADVVVTPALEAETERLLSQRTRDIRFSPEMVRAYRQRDYLHHKRILLRKIIVEGMGHAWSGGDERHPFNDRAGPDASRLIWEFVSMFRRD